MPQDDKTASLDISTNDFTSLSFFPHEIGAVGAEPLVHGFVSSAKIMDLMSQFKSKIVERIMPGLHKDGYAEQSEPPSTDERLPEEQPPRYSPRHVNPPAENPPYTQDRPGPYPYNRNTLFEVGRRDLDPIPLNPFSPPSLFPPGSGRGDGMLVGPDHPMFSGLRPRGPPGAWGGDGFLPPMGAPPRARFDPVGPGPFPGGGGGPRLPGRGNMHGPDNDEFLPPVSGPCPCSLELRILNLDLPPFDHRVVTACTCKLAYTDTLYSTRFL